MPNRSYPPYGIPYVAATLAEKMGSLASQVIQHVMLAGLAVPQLMHTVLSARWTEAWGIFCWGMGASHIRQVGVLNGTRDLHDTQVPIWNRIEIYYRFHIR